MTTTQAITSPQVLTLANISIRQDSEGRFYLNDLHKAAGDLDNHAPAQWFRNKAYKMLHDYLIAEKCYANLHITPMVTVKGNYTTGQQQGTYVVKELGYAYAMWISPKFHLDVIRAYDELVTHGVAISPQAATELTDEDLYELLLKRKEAKILQLEEDKKKLTSECVVLSHKAAVVDLVLSNGTKSLKWLTKLLLQAFIQEIFKAWLRH